jgi:hypothetical protein
MFGTPRSARARSCPGGRWGSECLPCASLQVPCGARPSGRVAELTALRFASLRSNAGNESDDEARGYARRPECLRSSAAHTHPSARLGTALRNQWLRSSWTTNPGDAKPRVSWSVGASRTVAGAMHSRGGARTRALGCSDSPPLFERSAAQRSEVSWRRARACIVEGSRSEAKADGSATTGRAALGFAAPILEGCISKREGPAGIRRQALRPDVAQRLTSSPQPRRSCTS